MARNYRAQGCAFIAGCVFLGFLLSLLTPLSGDQPREATDVLEAPVSNSPTTESAADDVAAEPDAGAEPTRPDWLLGTWAAAGECNNEQGYYFRFAGDGTIETTDFSGSYQVADGLIQISDIKGSDEMLASLGGNSAEISFDYDEASDRLSFKNNPVERCPTGE